MARRIPLLAACLAALAVLVGACSPAAPSASLPAGLRIVADWPLPGSASRYDYESLDEASHRLVIAHLGAGTVTIVDTRTHRVVADIGGIADAHGVLVVPSLRRIYASATGHNAMAVIDSDTERIVATVPAGDYPDGIAYDPLERRLAVSDEHAGTDTIIDATTNTVLATVALGGEAGNTQYDPTGRRWLVGVQTRGEIAAIDPVAMRVTDRYPTPGCEGPHGLLVDAARGKLFVACEDNARLLVFDLTTMHLEATDPVGETPDVLALDPGSGVVYVAAESGVLAVFGETGTGVQSLGLGFVGPNAHSVAVDPETHHVYLPLESLDGKPVLRELAPAGSD